MTLSIQRDAPVGFGLEDAFMQSDMPSELSMAGQNVPTINHLVDALHNAGGVMRAWNVRHCLPAPADVCWPRRSEICCRVSRRRALTGF